MVQPNNDMKTYILAGAGAFLCILGIPFFCAWSTIVQSIIHQQIKLTPGSQAYNLWKDTPIPMYMNFYLYNWTNYDKIATEKPNLVEMGPYRFNLEEKKTNITMNSNGTVTFQIKRTWFFDPENSNGTLDDKITTLNAVALSAAYTARDWSVLMKSSINLGLKTYGTKIQVTVKVGEILFTGYSDPLINMAKSLPSFAGIYIPYDRFGWFYTRNTSSNHEGIFNMDTGENDIYNIGKLYNWNYKSETGFYPDTCGMINGSAGELFPPKQTKDKKLQLYSADLCRSVSLSYKEEVDFYGIRGYKYAGDEYTFDNGTLDPSNECFTDGDPIPSGVLNVTSCRYGAPGYVSFPHFLLADDFYKNSVDGINAEPEKHTLYITVEPETGIPLDVAARFQINILLAPYNFVGMLEGVQESIVFPMVWFEQRATITSSLAFQLKLALYATLVGQTLFFILILIGLILIAFAIIYIAKEKGNGEYKLEMNGVSTVEKSNTERLLSQKEIEIPRVISAKTSFIN